MRCECEDFNGVKYVTLIDMCTAFGISSDVYLKRLNKGWSNKDALCKPVRHINKSNHIGETILAKCGLSMTITDWRNCNDIDVQFEDGATRCNARYDAFKQGSIKHPNIVTQKRTCHVGETTTTTQGYLIKIVEYNQYNDIVVRFESGETKHTDYRSFKRGNVACPGTRTKFEDVSSHVGEVAQNAAKTHTLTVISAVTSSDITVQFEDGTIKEHATYHDFKTGKIRHPKEANRCYEGEIGYDRNGLELTCVTMLDKGRAVYRYTFDGTEIESTTKQFRGHYIQHPRMPKIGANLRNFKVNNDFTVLYSLHTPDTKPGEYFVCLTSEGETILTKQEIINYMMCS